MNNHANNSFFCATGTWPFFCANLRVSNKHKAFLQERCLLRNVLFFPQTVPPEQSAKFLC